MVKIVKPEIVNTISEDGAWEEMELSVDTGYRGSGLRYNADMDTDSPHDSQHDRDGIRSGKWSDNPNEGEQRLNAFTEEGRLKNILHK